MLSSAATPSSSWSGDLKTSVIHHGMVDDHDYVKPCSISINKPEHTPSAHSSPCSNSTLIMSDANVGWSCLRREQRWSKERLSQLLYEHLCLWHPNVACHQPFDPPLTVLHLHLIRVEVVQAAEAQLKAKTRYTFHHWGHQSWEFHHDDHWMMKISLCTHVMVESVLCSHTCSCAACDLVETQVYS